MSQSADVALADHFPAHGDSPGIPGATSPREAALLRLCRVFTAATIKVGNTRDPALSASQIRTLTMLAASADGMSLGAVAQVLGTTSSAASRVCSRLVRDGLVTRGDGPGNEIRLALSTQGVTVLAEVNRERLLQVQPLFDALPESERDEVGAALERLATVTQAARVPW